MTSLCPFTYELYEADQHDRERSREHADRVTPRERSDYVPLPILSEEDSGLSSRSRQRQSTKSVV